MPQKKNPDAAELLRAKAPRIVAHLAGLHGVMHALPLTYNKDMQEDKEHLFDAVDTLELSLAAARGMLESMTFKRERLASAATDEMLAAVDVADMLVKRGVPFRQAHGVVAGLVRTAVESGRVLSQLTPEELQRALRGAGRGLLLGAIPRVVAGVQGERGRDLADPRARAARPRQGGAGLGVLGASAFYDRPVLEVAPALLGCIVEFEGCAGRIVETEAYHHTEAACHAYVGLTARTSVLYGAPGTAYVYRSYGIHALLNAVCEPEDVGAAVLIRALEPLEGLAEMRSRRGAGELCNGPGKLTQAMGISLSENNTSLIDGPIVDPRRRTARVRHRPADRHHQGRRAPVAVLRVGVPGRLASLAARLPRLAAPDVARAVRRWRRSLAGLAGLCPSSRSLRASRAQPVPAPPVPPVCGWAPPVPPGSAGGGSVAVGGAVGTGV